MIEFVSAGVLAPFSNEHTRAPEAMRHSSKRRTKRFREEKVPCVERERLEKAYQDAIQKKHVLEDVVNREVVSVERSRARRAKNQREAALSHAIHILNELLAHNRKHGCLRRLEIDEEVIGEAD